MTVSNKLLLLLAILSSVLCLPGNSAGQDSQLVSYRESQPGTADGVSHRPSWLKLPTLKAPPTTMAMPNFSQSFEKLGQDTQRLMKRTKRALTPSKTPNLRLPTLKLPSRAKDRPAKHSNLFGSLFKKRPAASESPQTLNDWLAQPRP